MSKTEYNLELLIDESRFQMMALNSSLKQTVKYKRLKKCRILFRI